MDYLKFVGLCLLAGLVFGFAGVIVAGYPSLALGLVITGAGFWRVKPDHFKFGYAVWIAVSLISYIAAQWAGEMAVRAESGNPYAFLADMNYVFGWFAFCAVSNPVCYWFGKRLQLSADRRRAASALAEHFD